MSKILIVQPDRMLQQAFTLALLPEFEVQMLPKLPVEAPKDVDAAIVDVAALQEYHQTTARELRALRAWKVPILWIENQAAPAADRQPLPRLQPPVSREALRQALAQCLRQASSTNGGQAATVKAVETPVKATPKKRNHSPSADHSKFIELVDVVEEGAPLLGAAPHAKKPY